MKVRIVSCLNYADWYSVHVGDVIEVEEEVISYDNGMTYLYRLVDSPLMIQVYSCEKILYTDDDSIKILLDVYTLGDLVEILSLEDMYKIYDSILSLEMDNGLSILDYLVYIIDTLILVSGKGETTIKSKKLGINSWRHDIYKVIRRSYDIDCGEEFDDMVNLLIEYIF